WGDPLARDPHLVAKEILQGLVTPKGALAYGVVAGQDGVLDEAATNRLRARILGERTGELPLFNYGPSIETLRDRSLVETGRPAPRQPSWSKHHTLRLAAE